MNEGLLAATALFVLALVLGLAQLWFEPFSPPIFLKLELTLGTLFLIVLVLAFVAREYRDYRDIQRSDRLDD